LQLDALSGVPGHEAELAGRAAEASSPEVRSFALAALLRSLGSRGTADLLAGRSPLPLPPALAARVRALPAPTAVPPLPQPAAPHRARPPLGRNAGRGHALGR